MTKLATKQAFLALRASGVLMVALGLAFYADFFLPSAKTLLSLLIIIFQLMTPFYILEKWNISPKSYNIYAHKIETLLDNLLTPFKSPKKWPHWRAIVIESISLLKICLIFLLPYICLYLGLVFAQAKMTSNPFLIKPTLPPNFLIAFLTQIFVVALPEEIFFRGFLQGALLSAWPNHFFIKGIPLGRAILLTNIAFALSHFVNGFAPARLLTFFPGLLFSYLVYRNKSIYSAVLFHAICNIVGQILYLSL